MESAVSNAEDDKANLLKEQINELENLLLALNQTHHTETLRHLWTTICDYQKKLVEKNNEINRLNNNVELMSKTIRRYKHKINQSKRECDNIKLNLLSSDEILNENDATALVTSNGVPSDEYEKVAITSNVPLLSILKIKHNRKHGKSKQRCDISGEAVIKDEKTDEQLDTVNYTTSETIGEPLDIGIRVKSEKIDSDDELDSSQQDVDIEKSMLQLNHTPDDVGSLLCTILDETQVNTKEIKYSKPFGCHICTKTFMRVHHLKTHLRVHTGERPFSCDICKKSFTQKGSLTKHIQIHTGERPYRCEVCTKSFKQLGHLQAHFLYHTGERSHTCTQCNKSFVRKHHLERHSLIHSGVRDHDCKICNRSFNQAEILNRHIERTHSNKHSINKLKKKTVKIPIY